MQELLHKLVSIVDVEALYLGAHFSRGEAMAAALRGDSGYLRCIEDDAEWCSVFADVAAAGFTYVGAGNFAMAVEHPDAPEVVFKIEPREEGRHNPYIDFARYCMQNPDKHLPTIHEAHFGAYTCVYVLDKLIPNYAAPRIVDAFSVLNAVAGDWMSTNRGWRKTLRRKTQSSPEVSRTLCRATRKLVRWANSLDRHPNWDMHDGNIMYHPQKKAHVITDPFC